MDMAARARVRREAKSIVKDELEAGDGSWELLDFNHRIDQHFILR